MGHPCCCILSLRRLLGLYGVFEWLLVRWCFMREIKPFLVGGFLLFMCGYAPIKSGSLAGIGGASVFLLM